jgi:DNA-binding GntR family transcriptional regulator
MDVSIDGYMLSSDSFTQRYNYAKNGKSSMSPKFEHFGANRAEAQFWSGGNSRNESAMSQRESVEATSIGDEIAFVLEAEILDGAFESGAHLMQADLCARFGVSRTPVREALLKLQAQNLVELIPNRGARIRIPTLMELTEVYSIRAELEGYAASLAARDFSFDDSAALETAQSQLENVVSTISMPANERASDGFINSQMTRFNEEFHAVIHNAAGNQLLSKLLADLQRHFPKDYVWKAAASLEQTVAINVEDHRKIIEALRLRDAVMARSAMTLHVQHAAEILLKHLQDRGSVS